MFVEVEVGSLDRSVFYVLYMNTSPIPILYSYSYTALQWTRLILFPNFSIPSQDNLWKTDDYF